MHYILHAKITSLHALVYSILVQNKILSLYKMKVFSNCILSLYLHDMVWPFMVHSKETLMLQYHSINTPIQEAMYSSYSQPTM